MMSEFKLMWHHIRRRPVLWLAGLVLPPLFSLTVQLIYAQTNQEIVARLSDETTTLAAVLLILGAAFLGMVVAEVLHRATQYLRARFAILAECDLRQDLYKTLLRRRWCDLTAMHTGDLFTRYNEDAPTAVAMISEDLGAMIYPLVTGLGYCVAISITNPWLGALAGFFMVMVSLLNWRYTMRYQRIEQEKRMRQEAFTLEVDSVLKGKTSVRMMSLAARMSEALGRSAEGIADSDRDAARLGLRRALTLEAFASLCTTMMLPIAALMAARSQIRLPQVIYVAQLSGTLIAATQSFGLSVTAFGRDLVSVRRLRHFFDLPGEVVSQGDEIKGGSTREALALNGVGLAYGGKTILQNASMRVNAGEIVALVGASGSGKSSITKALLGLVDYSGRIHLWGTDIQDCGLGTLRESIAYVPEHNDLIDGTIVENVKLGRPEADLENVRIAMKRAGLDEFLTSEGILDREVGARGSDLSGGQRQRVALARAFLKDARIIVLDEPTAALDSASEAVVLDSLREMRCAGKSILMITHRPTTLEVSDRIVTLEGGGLWSPPTSNVGRTTLTRVRA
jgi:ABC-type multidrug transport system fused ATPase/permease subunit